MRNERVSEYIYDLKIFLEHLRLLVALFKRPVFEFLSRNQSY